MTIEKRGLQQHKSEAVEQRMKRYLPIWLLLGLAPQLAMAQTIKTEIVGQSKYFSPRDKLLRAFVPKGGKTRFWGKSKLKFKGKEIWIHVYDVRKKQFAKNELKVDDRQQSGLDLFIFPRSRQLKRVSSTRFAYKRHGLYGEGGDAKPAVVQRLWLDPQRQKVPVVRIDVRNVSESYGVSSQYVICVFNQGVDENAVVEQRFGARDFNAPDWNSWKTRLDVMDNGMLGIVYSETDADGQTNTFYKWSNNHFEPFRKTGRSRDSDNAVELPFSNSD